MKDCKRHWLAAGAFATVLLAGCASEAYVSTDDGHYHHHHDYYHRYEGRPPGYYHGEGVGVYVAPEPPHPYRW